MKSELTVAKILKPRGLKGEMRMETYLSDVSQISKIKKVKIDKCEYTVGHIVLDGVFGYISLKEVESVEDAEKLRGKEICVSREDMPKLPDGKYYIVDMIGLDVVVGGEIIGQVADIAQYGSADVYTIRNAKGTLCFPAIPELIVEVDTDKGVIKLDGRLFERVVVYN